MSENTLNAKDINENNNEEDINENNNEEDINENNNEEDINESNNEKDINESNNEKDINENNNEEDISIEKMIPVLKNIFNKINNILQTLFTDTNLIDHIFSLISKNVKNTFNYLSEGGAENITTVIYNQFTKIINSISTMLTTITSSPDLYNDIKDKVLNIFNESNSQDTIKYIKSTTSGFVNNIYKFAIDGIDETTGNNILTNITKTIHNIFNYLVNGGLKDLITVMTKYASLFLKPVYNFINTKLDKDFNNSIKTNIEKSSQYINNIINNPNKEIKTIKTVASNLSKTMYNSIKHVLSGTDDSNIFKYIYDNIIVKLFEFIKANPITSVPSGNILYNLIKTPFLVINNIYVQLYNFYDTVFNVHRYDRQFTLKSDTDVRTIIPENTTFDVDMELSSLNKNIPIKDGYITDMTVNILLGYYLWSSDNEPLTQSFQQFKYKFFVNDPAFLDNNTITSSTDYQNFEIDNSFYNVIPELIDYENIGVYNTYFEGSGIGAPTPGPPGGGPPGPPGPPSGGTPGGGGDGGITFGPSIIQDVELRLKYVFLQTDGTCIIHDAATSDTFPLGKLVALRLAVSGILNRQLPGAFEKIKISSRLVATTVSTSK